MPRRIVYAVGRDPLRDAKRERPAFAGETVVQLIHAVLYEQPPILTGPATTVAVESVTAGRSTKKPGDRFQIGRS